MPKFASKITGDKFDINEGHEHDGSDSAYVKDIPILGSGSGTSITFVSAGVGPKELILEGRSSQSTQPTPSNPVDISGIATDVNLFDKDNVTNGYIAADGTISGTQYNSNKLTGYIDASAGVSYVYSTDIAVATRGIAFFDSSYTFISRVNDASSAATITTATSPANTRYIRCWMCYQSGVDVTQEVFARCKPKFAKGSTATPYSSYGKGTYTIVDAGSSATKNIILQMAPLRGIGTVKDIYTMKNRTNKYNLLELDGTEEWQAGSDTNSVYIPLSNAKPVSALSNTANILCSHYQASSKSSIATNKIAIDTSSNLIICDSVNATSVSVWKAFLAAQKTAGTPVYLIYELATSNTVAHDTIEQTVLAGISFYQGTNTITASDSLQITYYLNNQLNNNYAKIGQYSESGGGGGSSAAGGVPTNSILDYDGSDIPAGYEQYGDGGNVLVATYTLQGSPEDPVLMPNLREVYGYKMTCDKTIAQIKAAVDQGINVIAVYTAIIQGNLAIDIKMPMQMSFTDHEDPTFIELISTADYPYSHDFANFYLSSFIQMTVEDEEEVSYLCSVDVPLNIKCIDAIPGPGEAGERMPVTAKTLYTAFAGKVSKSGDTMTGNLTAPSVIVTDKVSLNNSANIKYNSTTQSIDFIFP